MTLLATFQHRRDLAGGTDTDDGTVRAGQSVRGKLRVQSSQS
jgi:hypothetical protein